MYIAATISSDERSKYILKSLNYFVLSRKCRNVDSTSGYLKLIQIRKWSKDRGTKHSQEFSNASMVYVGIRCIICL